MLNLGISKQYSSLFTAEDRYFALSALMTPWSIGCVTDVVLVRRKMTSIHLSPSMGGWVGQSSTINAIFLFFEPKLWSSSLTLSSNNSEHIQLFGCDWYRHGKLSMPLKQRGFFELSMTNIGSLSPFGFPQPCQSTELCYVIHRCTFLSYSERSCSDDIDKTVQTHQHWRCFQSDISTG